MAIAQPGLLPGLEASWLEVERTSLEHLRVEALELAAGAARTIEPPLAESLAREAIAAAPLRESAWAALISALHARGNVAEALHAYEEVRTRLREELGAVPGRELLALHSRLLAETGDPPAASATVTPATPEHHRRRDAAADLVERDDELRAVDAALDRLSAGEGGVVLFEGAAGIGKTRLLAELRGRAASRGALVLEARAGLLEREFGYRRGAPAAGAGRPGEPARGAGRRRPRRAERHRHARGDRQVRHPAAWTSCTVGATHTHAGRWSACRLNAWRAAS